MRRGHGDRRGKHCGGESLPEEPDEFACSGVIEPLPRGNYTIDDGESIPYPLSVRRFGATHDRRKTSGALS